MPQKRPEVLLLDVPLPVGRHSRTACSSASVSTPVGVIGTGRILKPGMEKTRFFFNQPSGFFFVFGFWVF
jgi:hypothetical protein